MLQGPRSISASPWSKSLARFGPTHQIGRFGWKAQLGTVLSFSADAALNEMGITNDVFPAEFAFGVSDGNASCTGSVRVSVPHSAKRAAVLSQEKQDRRTRHRAYVNEGGADMPEIVDWTWPA